MLREPSSRRRSRILRRVAPAALLLLLPAGPLAAADEPKPASPWGFSGALGWGGAGGDFSNLLQKPIDGEFNFFRQSKSGAWRYGAGVSYGSFTMKNQPPSYPDLESEPEWGSLQIYGLGTRVFRADKALRPYLQLRAGTQRLHPRSELFIDEPEDPENKGLSRTHATSGFFVGVVPGLELKLTRAAFLDASFSWKYFSVEEYKFDEFPTAEGGASAETPGARVMEEVELAVDRLGQRVAEVPADAAGPESAGEAPAGRLRRLLGHGSGREQEKRGRGQAEAAGEAREPNRHVDSCHVTAMVMRTECLGPADFLRGAQAPVSQQDRTQP
jgi:hypothetical protein